MKFCLFLDTRIQARVFNSLKVKFPKLEDAEEFYNLTLSSCLHDMEQTQAPRGIAVPQSPAGMVDKVMQTPAHQESAVISATTTNIGTCTTSCVDFTAVISSLDEAHLTELANLSFPELAFKNGIDSNPAEFASLSVNAMKKMHERKRTILCSSFLFALLKIDRDHTRHCFHCTTCPLDW